METQPFKTELRLITQASIPIEDVLEGEELYRQLKEMLKNYSPNVTLNGQVIKMLEPCCKKPPVTTSEAKQSQQKGDANVNNS